MPTKQKDYYQILGISKSATPEEIKQAYRKLAMEFHPDRAGKGSEEKFKEINEAYQILSDPQKRAHFDQFGTSENMSGFGGTGSAGWGGFRSSVNFDDLFGGRGGFGNLGDLFENIMGESLSQVQAELPVKLTDILLGGEIQFRSPDNDTVTLKISPGTQSGTTFRFPGKGSVHRRGRGDLYVTVRLNLPRRLTKDQERILQELKKQGL